MNQYITWLDSSEGTSAARVGGKGASLARLGGAGFPVPPGFGVTVDAYHAFHRSLGLDEVLGPLAAQSGRPTPAEVREACGPLLARLEGASLPAEVSGAIATSFAELEGRAGPGATFAVRSSGVSEDGAGASFAGLYDSYINLTGEEAVLRAVLECYHCLWQPRAAHYRTIKGIDHRKEAMAVVIMQTVPSFVSGVAFTLNPVTGATDEVLINASWGLGEAIVSGMVTPDNYCVRKTGEILHHDVFDKTIRVVPIPGGTEKQDTPRGLATAPALTGDQIRTVAETAARVETHYGCPMDIEFAFDERGRFYLLQARPITTR